MVFLITAVSTSYNIHTNILAEHTGGDALTTNLNQYYNQGDAGFIILCAALVLLMMPGLGYFYSGLARRKSALSLILVCVMAYCVVSFQWYFWGYSVHLPSTFTDISLHSVQLQLMDSLEI